MSGDPLPPPRLLLDRYGLRPKKSWGQNFLGDPGLLERIAAACGPGPWVIEIGAGLGHLTHRLLGRFPEVLAIERDRDLAMVLREQLGGRPGFELLEANALGVDYRELAGRHGGRPAVAGNLPYHISSPILFRLLAATRDLGPWTFLLQREVADRLVARPGGRIYGALTVHLALHRVATMVLQVPAAAFLPRPRVDSALVRLEPRPDPLLPDSGPVAEVARRIVDDAFSARRKTLGNALSRRGWPREIFAAAHIDPGRRAETLSADEFAALARAGVELERGRG